MHLCGMVGYVPITDPKDGTRTGITNMYQSGPGSNGNKGTDHIHQSSEIRASYQKQFIVTPQKTRWSGVLVLCTRRILQPQPNEAAEVGVCLCFSNGKDDFNFL